MKDTPDILHTAGIDPEYSSSFTEDTPPLHHLSSNLRIADESSATRDKDYIVPIRLQAIDKEDKNMESKMWWIVLIALLLLVIIGGAYLRYNFWFG
jgi:hypothetical protein